MAMAVPPHRSADAPVMIMAARAMMMMALRAVMMMAARAVIMPLRVGRLGGQAEHAHAKRRGEGKFQDPHAFLPMTSGPAD